MSSNMGTPKKDSSAPLGPLDVDFNQLDFQVIDPDSGVKRGLKKRHLSMISLAGIIGPGLLVGTGVALAQGGPAALIIGFGIIGIVAFSIMQSLGEITVLYPSGGSFIKLADRMIDPAFSAAVGWNYFIIWFAVLANEYNAVTSILSFWSDKVPIWGYFLLLWSAFLGFQFLGVESFGETEFWLALVKVAGLIAFYIFSIVYAAGGVKGADAIGFRYWHDPGAFTNGFAGVAQVFVFCSTFYVGVESVAIAATETKNPSVAVPLAIRQVFVRIIFVYLGAAFFFGLTCPANADSLINGSSRALKSPLTIAIQNAGWESGVHLINAFILATCVSAINSSIYIASRTVLFMAQDGKAPKFLGRTNRRGVPIPAIIFANLFGALSLLNLSSGAANAYSYIVNLSGVGTFLVWGSISLIHIRFRQAWEVQGYQVEDLPFKSLWFPWNAWFGLFANLFLAFVQGWTSFAPFNAGNFVDAYILLPLFPIIYVAFKLWNKTHFWRLDEIDLQSGRRRDLEEVRESAETTKSRAWWRKVLESF